jgi:hypothetical protein
MPALNSRCPLTRLPMKPLLLTLTLLAMTARAADTPEALPTVTTQLSRDSSALPYEKINTLLAKLAAHGEGLVRMDFRIDARKTAAPLANILLAIASDEAYVPIAIDAQGQFSLPVLPAPQARGADLATNQPKGQLAITGRLALTTPPAQLDMATVRRLMQVSQRLKTELLPWYVRFLFPRIDGVLACAAEPRFELEWREGGQLLGLPLPVGEADPEAQKGQPARSCTLLTGAERWPDAARLLAPGDATLLIKLGN